MIRAETDIAVYLIVFAAAMIFQGVKFLKRKEQQAPGEEPPPVSRKKAVPPAHRPKRTAGGKPSVVPPSVPATPVAEHAAEEAAGKDAPFDYARFLQQHGREAVILSEIVLPPDSRASGED